MALMHGKWPASLTNRQSAKRDHKRELLEDARRETGNPRLTWKGAKKYWRKLNRIARIASTFDLQDG